MQSLSPISGRPIETWMWLCLEECALDSTTFEHSVEDVLNLHSSSSYPEAHVVPRVRRQIWANAVPPWRAHPSACPCLSWYLFSYLSIMSGAGVPYSCPNLAVIDHYGTGLAEIMAQLVPCNHFPFGS